MSDGDDHEARLRRAHMEAFNPPRVIGGQPEDELTVRAMEFLRAGRPDDLVSWIERNVSDWRTNGLALHLVGQAHKWAGRPERARRVLLDAERARRADLAATLSALSEGASDLGDDDGAWRYLERALDQEPSLHALHGNRLCLASLAEDEERLAEAFRSLERSIPEWWDDPGLRSMLLTDGELVYLRERSLVWREIEPRILDAEKGE